MAHASVKIPLDCWSSCDSGHYGSELDGTIRINEDAHSFLVGPRISLRGKRFDPFTYAVFGATRFHQSATIADQKLSRSDTGFSLAIGGGLDVKVSDRIAIRAFQLDYSVLLFSAKRTIAADLHLDWYFELARNNNAFSAFDVA